MFKALVFILLSLTVLQAKDTFMVVYANDKKISVKVSLANFGYFKYGHKLTGRLQIGSNFVEWGENVDKDRLPLTGDDKTKQTAIQNYSIFKNDTSGCKNYQQFNEQYIQEYGQPIYLVDRGNCTFVRKANSAAKYGKMLIIVDNSEETDVDNIIMGDDLSGTKVMIPVVMISKKDGDTIKEFIDAEHQSRSNDEDKQIWISITFNKPYEKEQSEVQYWMIPSEKESYGFLKNHTEFMTYLIEAKKIVFEPHFVFFRCDAACKKSNENKTEAIDSFCINDGKFCHPDPDGKGPLTGVDSIKQTVREMCIQNLFPNFFLSYFVGFHECYVVKGHKFLDCDKEAIAYLKKEHLSADADSFDFKIKECQNRELFSTTSPLLEKEYTLYKDQGLKFTPALFVNGDHFRGDLQTKEAAEEFICASIEDIKEITVCDPYSNIADDKDKYSNKFISSDDSHVVIIVCAVLFFVFLIGLFMYRRKIKQEVQKELTMQVDAAIQQYYALNESK